MLCRYIKFRSKPKAVSTSLETLSILRELSNTEWTRFDRSRAPSPPERPEVSAESSESLVTPEREVVIEPSVKARFQVLKKID
jgi:hypothetical protein